VDADRLIADIGERLHGVPGIVAVALGGSRAAGTHAPASDIDIGVYYDDPARFDLAALRAVAAELDDRHDPAVLTEIGGWGPWVNGGGWLSVAGQAVDLIYRDRARVRHWAAEAVAGRFEMHYQWGHPHAFLTTIYAAEIATCRVLWEADEAISVLKAWLAPYPPALQAALVQRCGGEAEFCVLVARHSLPRQDVAYLAGCCFRAVACLMQVLFALNGRWLMNEKGAVATAARLPITLPDLAPRVAALFAHLAPDAAQLAATADALASLVADVRRLGELAQP
jgi:predicted nucleotidyltransferase